MIILNDIANLIIKHDYSLICKHVFTDVELETCLVELHRAVLRKRRE